MKLNSPRAVSYWLTWKVIVNEASKDEDLDDPKFNPFVADEEGFGDVAGLHARLANLRVKRTIH